MRKITSKWLIGILVFWPLVVFAQDEDLYFQALDIRGKVMAYHDQVDSTATLHKKQVVDDGDWVTTGPKSHAVLRMKDRAYLYIAPNSRVYISRLEWGEKGPICQLKLIRGRVLGELDQIPFSPFEVTAGNVLCAVHGTLFEVSVKKEDVRIISFEGSVVTTSHGKTQIAKTLQLLKYERGRFRYKNHHLKAEDEDHLQTWKEELEKIENEAAPGTR